MIKINVNHFRPEELVKLMVALVPVEMMVLTTNLGSEDNPEEVSLFTFIDNFRKVNSNNEKSFKNKIVLYLENEYNDLDKLLYFIIDEYGDNHINLTGQLSKFDTVSQVLSNGDYYDKESLLHEYIKNFK